MSAPTLIRPPRLNTGQAREANRLELFFDLAYVFVVAELAVDFGKDLTWHGLGVFAGLFTMIWFSWLGFTLYANRFDTDDAVFRVLKLCATLAIAGCAASATGATGPSERLVTAFVLSYLAGRLLLLVLYVRAWFHVSAARGTSTVYTAAAVLTCSALAASLVVEGPARYWLWAVAVAADVVAVAVSSQRADTAPLHMEHLPERLGLFVILVLGEGVLGAITAVHDTKWAQAPLLTAIAGFVVIAALWWAYFDACAEDAADSLREDDAVERDAAGSSSAADAPGSAGGSLRSGRRGESPGESGVRPRRVGAAKEGEVLRPDRRHDVYIYTHLPISAGIAAAAVGLKELALHPQQPAGAPGWLVAAGLAVFFLGLTTMIGGTSGRAGVARPWPILGVVLSLAVAVAPTASAAAWVAAGVTALLVAVGTWAHRRNEPGRRTT